MKITTRIFIGAAISMSIIVIVVLVRRSVPISSFPVEQNVSVVATFYPLAYMAERIGDDNVTVSAIVPNGTEPHDYAPLPRDIQTIYASDLLLANGLGIDDWAEDLEDDFTSDQHITLVVGEELDLPVMSEGVDSHIWLDPVYQQTVAAQIQAALSQVDPAHASEYKRNATTLITNLQQLDSDYTADLADCAVRTIIVSHDAFGYLGQRYGFDIVSITGLNPNSVPSAKTLAELTRQVQAEGIKYIFFETLVSSELSQALAAEVSAETLVLNPLEGLTPEEQAAGAEYFSVMRQNLHNLRTALTCQ